MPYLHRLLLLLVLPLSAGGQNCLSEIKFAMIDSQRVVVYNLSTGYSSMEWQLGDARVENEHESALILSFDTFPATICLSVSGDQGCQDQKCVEIYPGAPDDLCLTDDCIWPGDANGDGQANNLDLLSVGLAFGEEGMQRSHFPVPGQPNIWAPNFGPDWPASLQGINHKHIDANGDGQIDEADTVAILENYRPAFNTPLQQGENAPAIQLRFLDTLVEVDPGSDAPIVLPVEIFLGTADLPATAIHGLVFSLEYPLAITDASAASFEYVDTSFFGNTSEVLPLQKDLAGQGLGRVDLALSRKGGATVDGFGILFRGNFVVIADIAVGKGDASVPYQVSISEAALIDADGNLLALKSPDQPAKVDLGIGKVTSNTAPPGPEREIKVFPNPVRGTSRVSWGDLAPRSMQIFDPLGRLKERRQPLQNYLELDTSGWAAGIYILQLRGDFGEVTKKLIVR